MLLEKGLLMVRIIRST